jgi:hypothetical protein
MPLAILFTKELIPGFGEPILNLSRPKKDSNF